MASYGDTIKQYHIERVRDILVRHPGTSVVGIVRYLLEGDGHQDPLDIDRRYVAKLVQKIHGERLQRMNRVSLVEKIAEMEDRYRTVAEQMWKIVLDGTADGKGRVAAAKVIVDAEKNLLDAQMDAGIFDRKLGTLGVAHDHQHTFTLPEDVRAPILRAFRNYGIIKPATYRVIDAAPTTPAETAGVSQ